MALLTGAVRLAAAAALITGLNGPVSPSAQSAPEHAVKAAFLYNFTRFVAWPDGIPAASEPFRLCVVADAPTRAAIEETMQGELIQGRPAEVHVPQTPQEARRCQILYIGRGAGARGTQMLNTVRSHPVLTVGETNGFIEQGTIQFVVENDRVRFDVNMANAERARLTVNSRLLRVARDVKSKDGSPR